MSRGKRWETGGNLGRGPFRCGALWHTWKHLPALSCPEQGHFQASGAVGSVQGRGEAGRETSEL